jgi:hypothetical protein
MSSREINISASSTAVDVAKTQSKKRRSEGGDYKSGASSRFLVQEFPQLFSEFNRSGGSDRKTASTTTLLPNPRLDPARANCSVPEEQWCPHYQCFSSLMH